MADRCGAVILAGGRGERMGGRNKAELRFQGQSFKNRILEELGGLDIPCFFSAGAYPAQEDGECPVIQDLPTGHGEGAIGPMGGIWSCFRQTDCELLFFVSCDMPFFHGEMAKRLLERWTPELDALIWRTGDGRIQPLCGLYSRSCLPALEKGIAEKNYRLRGFLDRVNCRMLDTKPELVPDFWFFNVNSQAAADALSSWRPPVLAVSGVKNTGKTTVLEGLVKRLSAGGLRVAVIKHDGHDFQADVPGTDSRRMKEAGAFGTVVYSAAQFLAVKDQAGLRAEDFFYMFPEADLILLEGQKDSAYPKIEAVRQCVDSRPYCDPCTVMAYVTDVPGLLAEKREGAPGEAAGKPPFLRPVFSYVQVDELAGFVIGLADAQAAERGLELYQAAERGLRL